MRRRHATGTPKNPNSAACLPSASLASCTSARGPAWLTALPDRPAARQNGVRYSASSLAWPAIQVGASPQRCNSSAGSDGDQRSVDASSLGGNARITEDATRVPTCPPRSNSTLTVPSGHASRPRTRVPSSTRVRTSFARKASVRRAVPPTMRIEDGCCAKPVA